MIALPLPLLLLAAAPASMCPTLPLTPAERAADSAVIRRARGQHVRPSEIGEVMASGRWTAVWATPADAERGVFFLRRDARGAWRYVYAWGGVVPPQERAETIAWARRHIGKDLPAQLASCFVDAVIAGK